MSRRSDPPAAPAVDAHGAASRARARALILAHGWNATAYQLLNPGIEHWFAEAGDAVVGYVRAGGMRIVAGAPVCPAARLAEVVHEFDASHAGGGGPACYFGAGERLTELLLPTGRWGAAGFGAQPSWNPSRWPEIVARKASLRAQLHRARNKGVTVGEWPPDRAEGSQALRRCLDEWLRGRGLPPLHFLVEPETLSQLADRRVFVAERARTVIGFLVASPVPGRRGWLIEQIIRGERAVNGTAELLVDAAMRTLAAGGAQYVTLGLSPLSKHSTFPRRQMPLWLRLTLHLVRAHGRRFYNFEGLDHFKAKLEPETWEEIVGLAPGRRFPPRALWATAAAFSRGSPILLVLRAVLKGVRQELRWLRERVRRWIAAPGSARPESRSPPTTRRRGRRRRPHRGSRGRTPGPP